MALIRYFIFTAVNLFACVQLYAQTIYYPATASQLLISTAADVAGLMQKAIPGSRFTIQSYTQTPNTGIVFIYDSTITNNQTCKVVCNGSTVLKFAASQDNGLNFGIYEYLQQLGFRFYQPGSIWEIVPTLSTPYKNIDSAYSCNFKYKNWFISGGHNTWVMDKNPDFYWDAYFGDNGHQWALYQRRNNMTGGSRFTGHRDDIMTGTYLETLQNNPCYVAPFNDSRQANGYSVPDINSMDAMKLWSTAIEKKYTQYKNTIFSNAGLYANQYCNFNYNYGAIGIEVPDGAHWANSKVDGGCGNVDFVSESDQHFTLANFTAANLNISFPEKRFQLYAYDGHADVPSAKLSINNNIDVQVVSTGFQSESSSKGLLNRWYNKTKNISEYHYLNLPQWSGETPSFYLDELKSTIQRLKEKQCLGIVWEASPAKFAILPFLFAANESLKNNVNIDNKLQEFCNQLFGNAANSIYQLLQLWSNDKTVTVSNGIQDNKYKMQLYFQLMNKAIAVTQNDPAIINERLIELKAYLHYMVLYFDWVFDQRSYQAKTDKAGTLCLYLAKTNKLQIVNSYFLISDIVNKYNATDSIFVKYNTSNGLAYQNGNLPLITAAEINSAYAADFNKINILQTSFVYETAEKIKAAFATNDLLPLEKINVKINYSYAKDYASRSEFYILANAAGSFNIKYTPVFNMPGKGFINFTVEAVDQTLGIVKDFSLNNNSAAGILYVPLPAAGMYKLTVNSKYKSAVDLLITTNGNYFYKNGPFLGNTIENYRGDLMSLPGYFYVPTGINKIYFSLNNSNPGGKGFASPDEISNAFDFRDNANNKVQPKLESASDSALFYLEVPAGSDGTFWQSFKMEQYRLCFANISNIQWYASRKPCIALNFKAIIKNINGECITQIATSSTSNNLSWKIYDAQKWYSFNNVKQLDLPTAISPNAIITLTDNSNCFTTKRISDDPNYIKEKLSCANAGASATQITNAFLYPNPGTGIFKCRQNNEPVLAENIIVFDAVNKKVASFSNTQEFNISQLQPGIYFYSLQVNKVNYRGKLVKM